MKTVRQKIIAAWRELAVTVRAYRQGMYPEFVYGKKAEGSLPVFVYHRIGRARFARHLAYLKANGYRPVHADGAALYLTGAAAYQKQVMLTFDDGFEDLYRVVFPLLRQYNVPVVVYLISGWVGTDGMLSWEQIEEMHASKLFDFQSHTMYHASVCTGSEPCGVVEKKGDFQARWNYPCRTRQLSNQPAAAAEAGNPEFPAGSRYSDKRRFVPSEEFVTEFTRTARGNPHFRLERILAETGSLVRGAFETAAQQEAAIREEIFLSRNAIEKRLPEKTVRHFAYPWFACGEITKRILKELGFITAAAGMSAERRLNLPGDDPFFLVRVSGDFVPALPGRKRQGFVRIMLKKLLRRIFSGPTA